MRFSTLTWIIPVAVLCWVSRLIWSFATQKPGTTKEEDVVPEIHETTDEQYATAVKSCIDSAAATYTDAEFVRITELLSTCLPPQLSPCARKVVDFDKMLLTCYHPNTEQPYIYSIYPFVIQDVYYFSDGCKHDYLMEYDKCQTTQPVIDLREVYVGEEGTRFVLDKDTLCTVTMDHDNRLTYTPVEVQTGFLGKTETSTSTRSLDSDSEPEGIIIERASILNQQECGVNDFTVPEYIQYLNECLQPLPSQFDSSATCKAEARHNDGILLSCISADGERSEFRVVQDFKTGLHFIVDKGKRYAVDINHETGFVELLRVVKSSVNQDSPYLAVDESQKLCTITTNQFNEIQLTSVNKPLGLLSEHDMIYPIAESSPEEEPVVCA